METGEEPKVNMIRLSNLQRRQTIRTSILVTDPTNLNV